MKTENSFLEAASNLTFSEEGSLKYKSTNDAFVDDFASLSEYKTPREVDDIYDTMKVLWNIDPLLTLKEAFYLRLISRDIKNIILYKKQIGAGLKYEFIIRMLWLLHNHPNVFKKNLWIIPLVGSWKDLFDILKNNSLFKENKFDSTDDCIYEYIIKSLLDNSPEKINLIKKFLPTIKSNETTERGKINSCIGRTLAKKLYPSYNRSTQRKLYRKLKSSGNAHSWQQLISQEKFQEIDFNKISGRALSKLSNSKFLENHNLESKFEEWLVNQKGAKFTGYPYELLQKVNKDYLKALINKQFLTLLNRFPKIQSNLISVVDVSGSMTARALGTNKTSYEIAISMAIFFSYFLKGQFSNAWLEFSNQCSICKYDKNTTPYDRFIDAMKAERNFGVTNLLSVAKLFASLRNSIKEEDFPTGIICISDGEFKYFSDCPDYATNFHIFKDILSKAGFSKEFVDNFKIILWDIPNDFYNSNAIPKFESLADESNFFYLAGFDPAGINFLFGTDTKKSAPKNSLELFDSAMDQKILNELRI